MKISVSSYSFSKLMEKGMTQAECIKKAKEMGFDGIEFSGIRPEEGYTEEGYAKYLKETAQKENFPITNFVFGADLIKESDEEAEKEVERVKRQVDIAEILGVKSLRHDVMYSQGRYTTFEKALKPVSERCREITEYAMGKGIKTMVENHGFFCQDADRVERLVSEVDHPNFSLLLDIGNFLCADEMPELSVSRVAHLAGFVHVKDFHIKNANEPEPGEGFFRSRSGKYLRGAILGQGNVPVLQCLDIVKKSGYDGYVSVEFEGVEDPLYALPICLSNLRKYLEN